MTLALSFILSSWTRPVCCNSSGTPHSCALHGLLLNPALARVKAKSEEDARRWVAGLHLRQSHYRQAASPGVVAAPSDTPLPVPTYVSWPC